MGRERERGGGGWGWGEREKVYFYFARTLSRPVARFYFRLLLPRKLEAVNNLHGVGIVNCSAVSQSDASIYESSIGVKFSHFHGKQKYQPDIKTLIRRIAKF